jgi:hypothetical protein
MMTGTNIISPIDRIGAGQNADAVSSYRNDTASLFQLKAAGDRFAQILGVNQNDTPLARGTLREAITQYASQNNIDPEQVEIISKVFSNNLDIQAGKEIILGNANTLPSLSDAARSTAFERNPSKVESFADTSKPNPKAEKAAVALLRDGESAARSAVGLVSSFREMPHASSLTDKEFSATPNARLDELVRQPASSQTRTNAYPNGIVSTNNAATLQNTRDVVNDIRTILGTDSQIAATGKKNGALAELDSAIDAWAKKNNIPSGIVSLAKAEIAADIGTYNGKLITASDEAGKLALAKFPVTSNLIFGDLNSGKRAAYAQEVKAELQSKNSAVLDKLETSQLSNLISTPYKHTMSSEFNANTNGTSNPDVKAEAQKNNSSIQGQEGGDFVEGDDEIVGSEGNNEIVGGEDDDDIGDEHHALDAYHEADYDEQNNLKVNNPIYWPKNVVQENPLPSQNKIDDIINPDAKPNTKFA